MNDVVTNKNSNINDPSSFPSDSSLTPGFVGTFTMGATNVISTQFDLHRPAPALIALGISALFAILIVKKMPAGLGTKFIYFVLNMLFIFMTALGATTLGQSAVHESKKPVQSAIDFLIAPSVADVLCCRDGVVSSESTNETCQQSGNLIIENGDSVIGGPCSNPSIPQTQTSPTPPAEENNDNSSSNRSQGSSVFFRPWL